MKVWKEIGGWQPWLENVAMEATKTKQNNLEILYEQHNKFTIEKFGIPLKYSA